MGQNRCTHDSVASVYVWYNVVSDHGDLRRMEGSKQSGRVGVVKLFLDFVAARRDSMFRTATSLGASGASHASVRIALRTSH